MERLILSLLFITIPAYSFDTESVFRRIVARAVAEPSVFFREIKSDAEITLPVRSGYDTIFTYSIFPSFFPFVFISPSLTKRIYIESYWPQIDIGGGIEYFAGGTTFARSTDDIKKASFWGYHGKVIISDSIGSRVRNFYGIKYSYSFCELDLSDDKKHELLGVEINDFRFKDTTFYAVFGVEIMRDINKYFSIQINYDLKNNNVVMKAGWYGKWFELGLNFYPDGIIPIHPVWNMRLNF